MIDLTKSSKASASVHSVPGDPGRCWSKDLAIVLDAPPDADPCPLPNATWSPAAVRTGVCGVVSPRVIRLNGGGYRMYYTQILPQPGFPAGANDYDHSNTRILSAFSADGESWQVEAGVRLSPADVGADVLRVVSSEVVPTGDPTQLRMYFECSAGPQSMSNSIRSAISIDQGLTWSLEAGIRLQADGCNLSSPRIQFLDQGGCRLYCYERGVGIISAVADEAGLSFQREPGVRVSQDGPFDRHVAFAPEILRSSERPNYIMYYAGYRDANRAFVLRAVSDDGLSWSKEQQPVINPGPTGWDAAKCSEMCVIQLPPGTGKLPNYRMFYEACDGTAPNERGVWRIASATTST